MAKPPTILGFLMLAACPVENDLGSTATDVATGGGTGSTGGESSTTDPPTSLSQTSSPSTSSPTSTDTESGVTTDPPLTGSSGGETETTTGAPSCDGDGTIVLWSVAGSPVTGLDAAQRIALAGDCTIAAFGPSPDGEPPQTYDMRLVCELDGYVDGEPVTAMAAEPALSISSAYPLSFDADAPMYLRIAAEQVGKGWNRWFILNHDDDAFTFAVEAIAADRLHPQDGQGSPLIDEIGGLLGDDGWSSPAQYQEVDGACEVKDTCEAVPLAVEAETFDGEDSQIVQPGDSTTIAVGDGEVDVLVYVGTALDYEETLCDDAPTAWFTVGAIGVDP